MDDLSGYYPNTKSTKKVQYSIQKLQRYNDRFIMGNILEYKPSITTRRKLNAYILFLNVTCLSEIIFIDGNNTIQGFIQGNLNTIISSTLH